MGLSAPVDENGNIIDTNSTTNTISKTNKNSSLDKQAFLQLLVAQMKYQDPLEPTSNTEYIAQLATFSQLEETQNLRLTNEIGQASDLVGKYVILAPTDALSGETYYMAGKVDAIVVEGDKVYLSVNGQTYNLSDLDTVLTEEYFNELTGNAGEEEDPPDPNDPTDPNDPKDPPDSGEK